MSIELTGDVHITSDDAVEVIVVANNPTDEKIRLGGKIKTIRAWSDSVEQYGETRGQVAAPQHLDIPPETAKVFTRKYFPEQRELDVYDDIEFDREMLHPEITEEVTVVATVFTRADSEPDAQFKCEFTPADLSKEPGEAIIEREREFPLTSETTTLG